MTSEAGVKPIYLDYNASTPIDAAVAARNQPVLCFAHVTNQMGRVEGDFEKGVTDGAEVSLNVILNVARRWRDRVPP